VHFRTKIKFRSAYLLMYWGFPILLMMNLLQIMFKMHMAILRVRNIQKWTWILKS
jgi:hypothetical protein